VRRTPAGLNPAPETQRDFGLVETGGCAPPVVIPRSQRERAVDAMLAGPAVARGARFNAGKPRISLVDPAFIRDMAAVLTYGAEKYKDVPGGGVDNWKKGMPVREVLDSGLRHLLSFQECEDCDPESGLPHLAHAAVNLMFVAWMLRNKPDFDDRPK
jgi:hypothetical protein